MRIIISISIYLIFLNVLPQDIYAESDTLTSMIHSYNAHQDQNFQEKIYVQLDKSYYLSGEYLRIKVYNFDASTNIHSSLSKVVYLELIDSIHTPVIQTKILLDGGIGYGEIYIPSNFKSGNYILRGYTNWMKNYRPDLYFESIVHIINPFINPGLKPKPKINNVDIEFFPEGGNLLYGINSRIGFKATNGFGQGVDFSGRIIDDQDSIKVEFSSVKYGIGTFDFKPNKNRTYRVIGFLKDGSEINPTLPEIKNEGVILRIDNMNPDELNVEVLSKYSFPVEDMLLIGQTAGKIQVAKKINISNGIASTRISKENLDPGVMHISILNLLGKPVSERQVFIYPENNLNINIGTEKSLFKIREKVTVNIHASDKEKNPINMELSISVLLHDQYFDKYNHNIQSYLLLSSDLKGKIENPDYYLDGKNEKIRQAMDNLMLTQSYRRFLWEDMNRESTQNVYIPEYRSHILTGTITNKKSKEPIEGIMTYLSVPSKNPQFYAAKSKKGGKLFFEVIDFIGKNQIVVQTNSSNDSISKINIDNPFSSQYSDLEIPFFDINENMSHFIEKASRNMQIQNTYIEYTPLISDISNEDSSTFYHPDSQYYLDDYTRFPVMEEVIREYIVGVYVRKNQHGFRLRMLDMPRKEQFKDDPLVLLDGVPVFDANEIIELDPLKIKKIETVKQRFLKGEADFSGIVSFSTYDGNLEGYQLSEKALVSEYSGIQIKKKYHTPVYDNLTQVNNRLPDYRNVLYWNPQFKTNENGDATLEFYTSDDIGAYEIRVEGICDDGRPVAQRTFIQVADD